MVAGDVGERAGGEVHAVDAALLEAMARGFKRQMIDTGSGKLGQDRMQLDRIRGGMRQHLGARRPDHADRAEARGAECPRAPKAGA